jgi:carboxypeptidase C (cathepsin A)
MIWLPVIKHQLMDGAGPCRIKDADSVEENPHAWNEWANIIYIDQPVGTGFSYDHSGGAVVCSLHLV